MYKSYLMYAIGVFTLYGIIHEGVVFIGSKSIAGDQTEKWVVNKTRERTAKHTTKKKKRKNIRSPGAVRANFSVNYLVATVQTVELDREE